MHYARIYSRDLIRLSHYHICVPYYECLDQLVILVLSARF